LPIQDGIVGQSPVAGKLQRMATEFGVTRSVGAKWLR